MQKLTVLPGVFIVNDTFEITLTHNAIFKPQCTGGSSGIVHGAFGDNSTVTDLRPPFYSSTTPQIFAIAVATVISYFLVILIFITPRTFFVGGPGGGAGFLTRRGLGGNSSVIGVGRRPLLQKIAAVTVAISMTIATADTFKVAKRQYEEGFMDSDEMVRQVTRGLEIRVVQVISDTFLWLAQVQTLIRLFPRHKEKVTIKWLGFALVLLDVIFSSLNNFLVIGTNTRPLKSRDAIPALSYLFELAIGFIYASCVIYYSMSKYRLAFYHAKMRNICLVALLSITSVLIPVVFFVIDVSSPDIATWGFYIRWVGAAAASVVVWEWVERIEALERDERKDGILGREIYDGDEMLEVTTANGVAWPRGGPRRDSDDNEKKKNIPGLKDRFRVKNRPLRLQMLSHNHKRKIEAAAVTVTNAKAAPSRTEQDASCPAPPAAVATPISRANTTSAASTVYAVRYHNLQTLSPEFPENRPDELMVPKEASTECTSENTVAEEDNGHDGPRNCRSPAESRNKATSRPLWTAVSNPFKRKRKSPPAEVAGAQLLDENSHWQSPTALVNKEHGKFRSRMDAFTNIQRDKLRSRRQDSKVDGPLPITVIPAQPRGTRTWSPDDLADSTKTIPARRDDGRSHNQFQQPQGGESINVTVISTTTRGRHPRSDQDSNHDQESPLPGETSSTLPRLHEPPDGELRPTHATGDQPSCEARQPVHRDLPLETMASSFEGTDGSTFSRVSASSIVERVSCPEIRPPSHDSNVGGLHMQVTASSGPGVPHTPSSQLIPLSPPNLPHSSDDAGTLQEEGRMRAPASGSATPLTMQVD